MMLPSKAVGSYPTFSTSPQPPPEEEGVRQLFSVALSVISTYFSALVEIPGYSPVHCSVLSGLSSQLEALSDSTVCSEQQKYLFIRKRQVEKILNFLIHIMSSCFCCHFYENFTNHLPVSFCYPLPITKCFAQIFLLILGR